MDSGRMPCFLFLAAAMSTGLAGCGADKPAATQVAVKVGGEEISVHQINHVLGKLGAMGPERAQTATKEVLERLIDQQVLIQKAVESKVDRDPQVLRTLDEARRQVLSQAYLEKAMANAVAVTADDRKAFYGSHPELFAERRIYRFQELAFSPDAELAAQVEGELAKARSLNELAVWLRRKNAAFSLGSSVKSAEQLPAGLAPRFHQMKDGQITLLPMGEGMVVMQLVASQVVPVSESEAQPAIDQYLLAQKRQEFAVAEVKRLRGAVTIEYQGAFANVPATPEPSALPAAPVAGGDQVRDSAAINKGLAGLK